MFFKQLNKNKHQYNYFFLFIFSFEFVFPKRFFTPEDPLLNSLMLDLFLDEPLLNSLMLDLFLDEPLLNSLTPDFFTEEPLLNSLMCDFFTEELKSCTPLELSDLNLTFFTDECFIGIFFPAKFIFDFLISKFLFSSSALSSSIS